MANNYDVIIVGSGFGGAVSACRLAESGMRVLVLERGRRWQASEYPRAPGDAWIWNHRRPERQNGWIDFRFWKDMSVVMGAGIGGGSLIYANVSLVPHQEQGFDNAFVIEAASGGVDLSNLADYLNDKRSLVGFKRLSGEAGWFEPEAAALVRGRMLNSIKAEYSYATAATIARDFLSQLAFGVKSRIVGQRKAISSRKQRQLAIPNAFICSGLVQLGYVNAVAELASTGKLPPSALSRVVFRDDLAAFLPSDWGEFKDAEQLEILWDFASGFRDELEAATPEHLAASRMLEWVYIVRNGLVHAVHSDEEAQAMLRWRPARRS